MAGFNVKDIRTYPRVMVLASSATFFLYMTSKAWQYRKYHFDERHNVIKKTGAERPHQVVKHVFENGPIILNAKRYKTLKHEGLGVDHEEWLKGKEADYVNASK